MAIQIACNPENDLCDNKNKKRKTREKDTTRAEERRKGGRINKADRREEAASIDRPLHEVRMRPRESGGQRRRPNVSVAERPPVLSLDVTPHYRCHCATTGRKGGLGTGGWVIYGPRTMPKNP